MKNRLRLLLVVTAGLLGLVFAASALGAYRIHATARATTRNLNTFEPEMIVQQTSYKLGASTTVGFAIGAGQTDDPPAKITIFSPAGYTNNLSQAPGSTIGKAIALVSAGAIGGGTILPLSGPVVVGNPADPALQAASQECRQSTTNQAVWVLNTSLQGQTIQIPDFVNVVGPYVIQEICLQSPADPRNTFKAQLLLANYSIQGVFTNASSSSAYQWAADFTPYFPGTVNPNPAATNEWRTFVGLPSSLTFKRVKSKSSLVSFSGALSIAALDPSGVKLHLYLSPKAQPAPNYAVGTFTAFAGTDSRKKPTSTRGVKRNGKYTVSMKRPKGKKKTFFQMRFENYLLSLPSGDKCEGPSPSGQPIPCNGEDLAPITTNTVVVAPAKKKHR